MAAIKRSDLNTGLLQTWLNRKALETFEPKLFFARFGTKPTAPAGYDTIAWAKFDQIAASSITAAADGVTPTDTDFDATVVSTTPSQYVAVVNFSDMLIENNGVNFLSGAVSALAGAMARKIDEVIQTEVMAGSNVLYAGVATSRSTLAVTDVLTASLLNKADAKLESLDAPTFDGNMYVAIIHPYQLYDLRNETGTGSWIDANKYATPDKIFEGEIGALNGVRVVVSSHVQSFASTATVYPALVIGQGAYGIADTEQLRVYVTPNGPTDSDPAAQRRKVAVKVAFAAKRLQENSMIRIETGATAI